MDFLISLGYFGIFLAAFLAATILPFGSEAVFTALYYMELDPMALVVWATLGNTLGGMTCYWLGHLGKIEWIEKYLKVKKAKIDSYLPKFQKYGNWIAFFSFLPGIGDIIAIAAGFIRANWLVVLVSMGLGKFVRYIVWMYLNGLIIN